MSFYLIVFALLGLIYGYTGFRLIVPAALPFAWNIAAWIALCSLAALPACLLFLRSQLGRTAWHDQLAWVAYLGLGFFVITFSVVAIRDLFWWGLQALDWLIAIANLRQAPNAQTLLSADPARRQFLLNATNLGVLGLTSTAVAYGLYEARRRPRVVAVTIPIANLPADLDGFRIAQISDIHAGPTIKRPYVQAIADQVTKLAPDLIAFTGDLVDGSVADMRPHVEPMGQLRAPHGTFFITGNHEYYSDATEWIPEARRLGFDVLLNEHRLIERGQGRLLLAGVTDFSSGPLDHANDASVHHGPSDPQAALHGAPPADVRILLAHQPLSIFAAAQAGFDLQLSGHTHGGQFIPWKYLIPLQQPYVAGLHRHDDTWIYVNRGSGYWGPPVRIGAPAEITLITLKNA